MNFTFLFWNTSRNKIEHKISNIADRYNVDVIILAERDLSNSLLITLLNEDNHPYNI